MLVKLVSQPTHASHAGLNEAFRNPEVVAVNRPAHLLPFLCLGLLALPPAAHAQGLSSDELLANLRTTAESLVDASFLLTGVLIDPGGTEFPLEIDVQFVPAASAASAYIIQPAALADNIIVLDGDVVKNYTFLTNQVTLFDTSDPDAFGALFDQDPNGDAFELTLDLSTLFEGYQATVQDYRPTPPGNAYLLRFDNLDEGADLAHVEAEIVADAWYPYSLTFFQADGSMLARLVFENFIADQGLDPSEVAFLPADAEIIDARR